jgi:hypothetical protein
MYTTRQREEKELVLADPIFQLALLNCEYEVVKSECMRSVGEVMAHWYSPFWDLGTTEGVQVKLLPALSANELDV